MALPDLRWRYLTILGSCIRKQRARMFLTIAGVRVSNGGVGAGVSSVSDDDVSSSESVNPAGEERRRQASTS